MSYLTLQEAAAIARCASKTLQNHMTNGILVEGVHFFRPRGRRVLFSRDAFIAWCEGRDAELIVAHQQSGHVRCRVNLHGV